MPLLTVSGKTGKGLDQLLAAAFEVRETWSQRVPTGQLNRWFEDAVEKQPAAGARRQADQAALHHPGQHPPAELRPVRHARSISLPDTYLRYLVNGIRRELGFGAVPVRLTLGSPKNPFAKG